MERAVVLVGISHAAGLPELPAVGDALSAMQKWARDQGLPEDRVTTLSDLDGTPVTFTAVCDAIEAYASSRVIEQLIVHFCGHGLISDGTEVWLLSDATRRTSEAISLAKTQLQAGAGKFAHVILIGDACRTLPEAVQDADIDGGSIFPTGRSPDTRIVDTLLATRRGAAALQVKEAGAGPDGVIPYLAVFTAVLSDALQGKYPSVHPLEVDDDLGPARHILLGPLSAALKDLVSARLAALGITVPQIPDAASVSYEGGMLWISRLPPSGSGDTTPAGGDLGGRPDKAGRPDEALGDAAGELGGTEEIEGLRDDRLSYIEAPPMDPRARYHIDRAWRQGRLPSPGTYWVSDDPLEQLAEDATLHLQELTLYPPPKDKDARARVVGARVDFVDAGPVPTRFDATTGAVMAPRTTVTPVPLLIRLESGHLIAAQVFADRDVTLIVEEDQLVDVYYTEVGNWQPMSETRARIGASARWILPWMGSGTVEGALRQFLPLVLADPSVGVLLAHELIEVGQRRRIESLLENDPLPDVLLLAGQQPSSPVPPMFSRTWPLLGEHGTAPRPDVPIRVSSPWTLYAPGGQEHLRILLF